MLFMYPRIEQMSVGSRSNIVTLTSALLFDVFGTGMVFGTLGLIMDLKKYAF